MISIVLPAYNEEQAIARTLDEIRLAAMPTWEPLAA